MPVRPKVRVKFKPLNINVILIGAVAVAAIITGILIGAFFAFSRDLPQIEGLKSFKPSTVSRVFSADDVLLGEFYEEKRDPLPLSKIPKDLKTAVIETEDQNFYDHSGIDLRGILRAIYRDIVARDFVEGASTISQQLAKTLFLSSDKTLHRKTQEAVLAFQLERRYTKDEILELYLNQVYFGSGAYGVESAANIFFGKSAGELSLSECALIAAMPKAPSRYSPLINPELAKERRNQVLKTLLNREYITQDVYEACIAEPVKTDNGFRRKIKAPYFVEHVKKEMESMVGISQLYKNGYTKIGRAHV
jgi:penicillin-binding protein 1A